MFRILRCIPLIALLLMTVGCARNYYNIPRENFEKQVRVLGVAPIFVDGESDIRHPEKDALVNVVKNLNRKNDKELVAQLKDTGSFFAVRPLADDPDKLFYGQLFRRERRDDAGVTYNKYFYKLPELKELISRNGLDAIMFTVVSGLTRKDTYYSSNILNYLESDYNFLVMTAQIFDADGNILWEYPNFRKPMPSLPAFFALQYPDFDEAKANLSDNVDVKFKTIPGISRALGKTEESSLLGKSQGSTAYVKVFGDMTALLKPEMKPFWSDSTAKKQDAPAAPAAK